jgi:hypothetical protein
MKHNYTILPYIHKLTTVTEMMEHVVFGATEMNTTATQRQLTKPSLSQHEQMCCKGDGSILL